MNTSTQTFPVEGMTCASCVRRIEKALSAVPGVDNVQVDLAREQATIIHRGVAPTTLAQAVADKGYHLVLQPAAGREAQQARWTVARLVLAWATATPLLLPMIGVPLHLAWPIQAMLAAIAAFGAGFGYHVRALRLARHGEASMDTLISIGSTAAFFSGLSEALAGAHHTSFEIAASLPAFVLLGKFIEMRAKHSATASLTALLDLAPATALRIGVDGSESLVPSRELRSGDLVQINPGGRIPIDGQITAGRADVDEAVISGEPLPVPKQPGDTVLAGGVVHGGSIRVAVTAAGSDIWLARLAHQVAEAQASHPPAQALADRISAVFVPVVLVLAALTAVAWWLISGSFAAAWGPAITVLVIACPCALGLATPVSVATALGTAARQGLLVRDGSAFARLATATDLVLDKTGTLTEGRPTWTGLTVTVDDLDEHTVRRWVASLERRAEHPVAVALRQGWNGPLDAVDDWRAIAGGGVSGRIAGRSLRLGSETFLQLPFPPRLTATAGTLVGLADDNRLLAVISLGDRLRPEAQSVLADLQRSGLRLHVLSGDRPAAVASLATDLPGISFASLHGGASPADKAAMIQRLQRDGRVVAFAGDGVNDAQALATAAAGISLPGLDAAEASAPLNLRRPGLRPILQAHRLARRLQRNIRENLAWAFLYNLILIPLAAFGQLADLGGPMLAGAAMGISSVTVVLNALRLRSQT